MAAGAGRLIGLPCGGSRVCCFRVFFGLFRPRTGLRLASLKVFPECCGQPLLFPDICGIGLFVHKTPLSRGSQGFKLCLPRPGPLWQTLPARQALRLRDLPARCGSSVVEHSLGKGEVESSILSHSTSPTPKKSLSDFGREYFLRDFPFAVDLQKAKIIREVARRQLTFELHEGGNRRRLIDL